MARGGHDREQRQDEAERHARQLTALAVTMIVIPTAAVALRFWSRLTRGGKSADGTRPLRIGLWWDDWAALLSLPFIIAHNGVILRWAAIGRPSRRSEIGAIEMEEGLKLFYIGNYFWQIANTIARLAAVLLYARVFAAVNRRFRIAIWVAGGLVAARFLVGVVGTGLLCIPASRAWERNGDSTCGHGMGVLVGGQIFFVVIDVVLLCLPLPMVWRLRLTLKQKMLVGLALFYGYCVPVISVGTLVANIQAHGSFAQAVSWTNVTLLFWALLEAPLAITTICLPPIFFLIKQHFRPMSRPLSAPSRSSLSRLKSVDSPFTQVPTEKPIEMRRSWPSPSRTEARPESAPRRSSKPPSRFPMPSSQSHRPRRSSEHRRQTPFTFAPGATSQSRYQQAYPMPVATTQMNDKPLPPIDLSSDLLGPSGGAPEYQTHIFTPAPITGVRRNNRADLAEGVIKVEREVNIDVRSGSNNTPLKDMLDTGLGLLHQRDSR